jgi:hypothetical protein
MIYATGGNARFKVGNSRNAVAPRIKLSWQDNVKQYTHTCQD